MAQTIKVTVNGVVREEEVEPRVLLVHFLRDDLRLTGTHVGCDTGQCGACTILVDGKSTKACNMFAVQANGREITTIEGLAKNGELHPIQKAFREEHGVQCGFCTPGIILATYDLLQRIPKPTDEEIRHNLEGNYCRCTGYHNIVKAVQTAAANM
jgi:carbon-monoxide dehydrogenase small subunit